MGLFWLNVEHAITSLALKVDELIETVGFYKDELNDYISETKEDFNELRDIGKEAVSDLSQTAIDLSLDYVDERVDRYFENWEVILSDDPYTDGKKEGYARAAEHFEALYKELQLQRMELLKDAKLQKKTLTNNLQNLVTLLDGQLVVYLKKIKSKEQFKKETIAKKQNISIGDVSLFVKYPNNSSLFDLIASKKMREKKKGEVAGYEEAKELYQKKFDEEEKIFQKRLEEYYRISDQMRKVIDDITKDIEEMHMRIALLDVLE